LKAVTVICPTYTSPGYHHQIETRKLVLMKSKTFANQTFNPISIDGASAVLFRYCQTKSGITQTVNPRQN
jgi:hypothetical protein